MGISDQISELIEKEVERRVYERVCKVLEKVTDIFPVSKKYARREFLPDVEYCQGITKSGRFCTNKATKEGFCSFHVNDERLCEPIKIQTTTIRHTHPFPSGFILGCPKCEDDKKKKLEN